jgi:ribosomal protein S27AE
MAISVQQKDAIDKWFKDHNLAPKCGLCGGATWKRDIVSVMRSTDPNNAGGGIMATGPGLLRMLRLTCPNCAGVLMLDAGPLGI